VYNLKVNHLFTIFYNISLDYTAMHSFALLT